MPSSHRRTEPDTQTTSAVRPPGAAGGPDHAVPEPPGPEAIRLAYEHGPVPTAIVGLDGDVRWLNRLARDLLGRQDAAGDERIPFEELVDADDLDVVKTAWQELVRGGAELQSYEARHRRPDGQAVWLLVDAWLVSDSDDRPQFAVVQARDTTKRRQGEDRLVESERRFRSAFEDAPVGMAIATLDGRYVEVNVALARILGRRRGELLRMGWQDVTHPDDLGLSLAYVDEGIARGRGYQLEKRYLRADGTVVWASLHVSVVVGADGRPQHVVAHVQDVTRRREIDRALLASEERFRFLAASSPVGILLVDTAAGCVYANDRFGELTGVTAARAHGDGWLQMADTAFRGDLARRWQRAASQAEEIELDVPGTRPEHWLHFRARPTHPSGDSETYVATVEDATATVAATREAAEARTLLGAIVEATTDLVAVIDVDGRPIQVNAAGRRLMGVDASDSFESRSVLDFFTEEAREQIAEEVLPRLRADDVWEGELTMRALDGREIAMSHVVHAHRGPDGRLEFVSTIARDISERKALEEFLAHQALHDPLTGLANRALFFDRIALAGARALRSHRPAAVLFLDLDYFKDVNDSLGHAVGDRVLGVVAQRIRDVVRPSDTVARLGGDEFGILCEDLSNEGEAVAIAGRLHEALSRPVEVADQRGVPGSVRVGVSVGVADLEPGVEPDDVLRDADAAMYYAKDHGRGRVERFRPAMRVRGGRRFGTEADLRRALEVGEIECWYQPVVSVDGHEIVAFEALARWRHPERGTLTPDEFLGIAEDSGLIVPLGQAVLDQVARDASHLRRVGGPDAVVWVNVSEGELRRAAFLERFADTISAQGGDPGQVGIEIHEPVLAAMGDSLAGAVGALASAGVPIAVDGFGAAGGRLLALARFDLTTAKLDGDVVRGVGTDPRLRSLATAAVRAAQALGCRVVAEGVEGDDHVRNAVELGCDALQGYATGRPVPLEELDPYPGRQA